MTRRGWKPFAAPAAFLLAVTIAVLVARAVLDRGGTASPPAPAPPVRTTAVTTTKKVAAKPHRLYTVRAGDTLAAIAARSGIPLARLRALNPSLEPTALFIGEKIRLK